MVYMSDGRGDGSWWCWCVVCRGSGGEVGIGVVLVVVEMRVVATGVGLVAVVVELVVVVDLLNEITTARGPLLAAQEKGGE